MELAPAFFFKTSWDTYGLCERLFCEKGASPSATADSQCVPTIAMKRENSEENVHKELIEKSAKSACFYFMGMNHILPSVTELMH